MLRNCSSCCNFYELVKGEEGRNWVL
jgi:hypothetical protein